MRVDVPPNEEGEKFEKEDDEHVEEEERGKRKWPDKNAIISRKYEVIGTVLNREVMSSNFLLFLSYFLKF